jgi:hypothetical protein
MANERKGMLAGLVLEQAGALFLCSPLAERNRTWGGHLNALLLMIPNGDFQLEPS